MVLRLYASLGLIVIGIFVGYVIQIWSRSGRFGLPYDLKKIQRRMQKFALLGLYPVAFVGAVWIAPTDNASLAVLPFVALFALGLGGMLAYFLARLQRMTRRQTGSYVISGWFTNIGSIGGLVCFFLIGEEAFALVPIYKLLEEFSYYGFGFPVAQSFSSSVSGSGREGLIARIIRIGRDPFVVVVLGSIALGFVLNISGLSRPAFYGTLNAILIPLASFILLVSIGMAMRLESVRRYFRAGLGILLVKNLLVPAATTALAFFLGLGSIANGVPLQVVLVLSSMPAAFVSIVPSTLYDLDVDLANSNWIISNAALIIVIPVLSFILK